MGVRTIALQEQAEELGYETIQEAIDAGYYVGYRASGNHYLYKPDEQELAHKAWLKEKASVIEGLKDLRKRVPYGWENTIGILDRAIEFIEKGEV